MSLTDSSASSPDTPEIHRRVFAALPVPASTASRLAGLARRGQDGPHNHCCDWVDTANYHVTLAFFGDLDSHRLSLLQAALDGCLPLPPPTIRPLTVGGFPAEQSPILAAALHPSRQLLVLHDGVIAAATAAGIPCRERHYRPHITLGRRTRGAPPLPFDHFTVVGLDFVGHRFGLYRGVRERNERGENHYRYATLASFAVSGASGNSF